MDRDGEPDRIYPGVDMIDAPYLANALGITADDPEGSPDIDDSPVEDGGLHEFNDTPDWRNLSVHDRHALLRERFSRYQDSATLIVGQQLATDRIETIPGYVGVGSEVAVFTSNGHPGIVFKVPCDGLWLEGRVEAEGIMRTIIDGRVHGLARPGLEQIVSYGNVLGSPVVACEYVEGRTLGAMDPTEREFILDEHFADLILCARAMQANGLAWDVGTSENVIYHPEQGFTIVDYALGPYQTFMQKVVTFATDTGLLDDVYEEDPVPEYALRYRDLCGRLLGKYVAHLIEKEWRQEGRTFS